MFFMCLLDKALDNVNHYVLIEKFKAGHTCEFFYFGIHCTTKKVCTLKRYHIQQLSVSKMGCVKEEFFLLFFFCVYMDDFIKCI